MRYRTILAIALVLGACSDTPTESGSQTLLPTDLAVISGDAQVDTVLAPTAEPVVVRAMATLDSEGRVVYSLAWAQQDTISTGVPNVVVCAEPQLLGRTLPQAQHESGAAFPGCATTDSVGDVAFDVERGVRTGCHAFAVEGKVGTETVASETFDVCATHGALDTFRLSVTDTFVAVGVRIRARDHIAKMTDHYGNPIPLGALEDLSVVADSPWAVIAPDSVVFADEADQSLVFHASGRVASIRVLALRDLRTSEWVLTASCGATGSAERADGSIAQLDSSRFVLPAVEVRYDSRSADGWQAFFDFDGIRERFFEDGVVDTIPNRTEYYGVQRPDSIVFAGGVGAMSWDGTRYVADAPLACSGGTHSVLAPAP